jgi:hypothetical protein
MSDTNQPSERYPGTAGTETRSNKSLEWLVAAFSAVAPCKAFDGHRRGLVRAHTHTHDPSTRQPPGCLRSYGSRSVVGQAP